LVNIEAAVSPEEIFSGTKLLVEENSDIIVVVTKGC
jgi:hypothetical protein